MGTDHPIVTCLIDYTAPEFEVRSIDLDVNLEPTNTHVTSVMQVRRLVSAPVDFFLDGEDIDLVSVKIDGKPVAQKNLIRTETALTLKSPPDIFTLEIQTRCNPSTNSSLMGLYVSGGQICSQCEAQGFRRITYFPDRPDILTIYRVKIEAHKSAYPILLSNGNCIEEGDLGQGRHYALWHDPFPKPCYLFALVAGKFDIVRDTFTTLNGRNISLEIYVDAGDAARADYAMSALKRAMKWDEEAFGREYDLDRFMIVSVRDFNIGAMENKGLNIFRSSLLLADEASATDIDFEQIENLVAHEYFHNWTGNRITCRDWFQLCLKEGFTVFRDQEFSAEHRGSALQRIKNVKTLRAGQFSEDASPLAHPVRPETYMKIDNFYTATVYGKGAELIRMLETWLGAETFRKGCDNYFDTLDGTAATVEQFIACFEKVSGKDLSQFMVWYAQAGTPKVSVEKTFDKTRKTFDVRFTQTTAPTSMQSQKKSLPIPVNMGLISRRGHNFGAQTVTLTDDTLEVRYENVETEPTLSVFRNFSAPIVVQTPLDVSHLLTQMRFDDDLFNRWDAGQTLARDILTDISTAIETGASPINHQNMQAYIEAVVESAQNEKMDMGFKALTLSLPSDGDIIHACFEKNGRGIDPLAVHHAGKLLRSAIAEKGAQAFNHLYVKLSTPIPFAPDANGAGHRALRNICLAYLIELESAATQELALTQFRTATNMTEELAGLIALISFGGGIADDALEGFYEKWKSSPLVIDKWFGVSAGISGENALHKLKSMTQHPAYSGSNPNRVRALLGGFTANNPEIFHAIDGSGYRFFTDNVLAMDKINPQVAAPLLGTFTTWNRLDPVRQGLIKSELSRILASQPSVNVFEIASKSLRD